MPISAPEFPAPTRRTPPGRSWEGSRSEEHTSELQSPYDLVCRLLLEKKKNRRHRIYESTTYLLFHPDVRSPLGPPPPAGSTVAFFRPPELRAALSILSPPHGSSPPSP